MKRIFSIVAAAVLFCVSAVFFAACQKVEPNTPPADGVTITAEVSKTEVVVGEVVTVTYSASKGTVSVTYSKDGGESTAFTGTSFTPTEAGVYVFTFSAEGAESVTKTVTVTQPVKPVISVETDKTEIKAGESVTFTYSATESATVTVTYTKDGEAADGLTIESGKAVTIVEAGVYVFTFSAEGVESVTKTVTVEKNTSYEINFIVDENIAENGGQTEFCKGTEIPYEVTISEGGTISSFAYTLDGGNEQTLQNMSGQFLFDTVGTYVFKITAENAEIFTYTVIVRAHTYGEAVLNSANTQVEFTCNHCGDRKIAKISGLTATLNEDAYAVIVDDGIEVYAVTLEASYGAVAGTEIQGGEIEISLDDPYLNVIDYESGKPGKIQFSLASIQWTLDNITVFEMLKEGESQLEMADYLPGAVLAGTAAGEFEYRFSLTNVMPINTSPNNWESWLLQFTAGNGATAVLRADDYILENFGRGNAVISTGAAAECSLQGEIPVNGDIRFVVSRTYENGAYTITVKISGNTTATVTIKEPVTNGNTMTFAFGGEKCRFGYSDLLEVKKPFAVSSISAEAIEVPKGTTLADAVKAVSVTISYEGSLLQDILRGDVCGYSCNEYQADQPQTYTVTLTYQGKTTTVAVTVQGAAYSLLKSYSVQGEEFTDGTTAVGTTANGTFANGGFKANAADAVKAENPYLGKNITAGITITMSVYVNASVQWAPILGFKSTTLVNDVGAFMCLVTGSNGLQLSYNSWNGTNYADIATGVTLTPGMHTLVLQMETGGTARLYIDDALYEINGGETAYSNALSQFLPSCDTLRFFGGGYKDNGEWNGLFDGYIQNCDFYNGIVPIEDLA